MQKRVSLALLVLSITCLGIAITALLIGSEKSKLYNQMKKTPIIRSLKEIKDSNDRPFLLLGYISPEHPTLKEKLVTYTLFKDNIRQDDKTQSLTILLPDGKIELINDYTISDYNFIIDIDDTVLKGIKPGSDITIYAITIKEDGRLKIKGHQLYPGRPDQYLRYLSSPFNSYMLYVRIFIGLALLFFTTSIILNIKK